MKSKKTLKIKRLLTNKSEVEKIDKLIELLGNVKEDTGKMSTHIDFIDNVYTKVKMPLFWICDKVNSIKDNGVNYTGIAKSFVKYNSEVPENTPN